MVRPTTERKSAEQQEIAIAGLAGDADQPERAKAVGGLQTRRQLRGAGEVAVLAAAGAGGRLAEDELFGGTPSQERHQVLLQVRSRLRPDLAEIAFGKSAAGADRQCLGFGNAESEEGDGMAGFVMGDTAAHIGRPFGLAAAYGIEQICQVERAGGGARHPARLAHPALDVGAGVPARGKRHGAKVGALKVCAEMRRGKCRSAPACRATGWRYDGRGGRRAPAPDQALRDRYRRR